MVEVRRAWSSGPPASYVSQLCIGEGDTYAPGMPMRAVGVHVRVSNFSSSCRMNL